MKLKIFTSESCPKCPEAKELGKEIEGYGIKVEYYDIGKQDNVDDLSSEAYYTVMSVPTILITEDEEDFPDVVKHWRGKVPYINEVLEYFDDVTCGHDEVLGILKKRGIEL